jgi:hypothetical protein
LIILITIIYQAIIRFLELSKTTNVTIQNPIINQNGVLGSDFMLVNTDAIDDIFHGIEVDITRKQCGCQ